MSNPDFSRWHRVNPVETELKFQVPAHARTGLRRALATASARTLRLQAVYADTADDRLAAAGLALRLRREGRIWVQTLKGRGDGLMARPEHEVRLPAQPGTPRLDLARHAGTPAGELLATLLADGAALQPRYCTDVRRLLRRVRSGGATVEVALDEGRIVAGERWLPVCEIEFELVAGPPAAMQALAERWALRHCLWLDVRTKSERGHRLARGLERVPAIKSQPAPPLDKGATPAQAFAAMLVAALGQALPNAAELAAGDGGPEHLHQLRVGLRRLRTALRLFATWGADTAAAAAIEKALREPFARLGAARDADVLAAWLLPSLAAAGAPTLQLPAPAAATDSAEVLRDPRFTQLMLRTMRLAGAAPAAEIVPSLPGVVKPAIPMLGAEARAVLRRAWRRVQADAATFAGAETLAQHRTRKRLKRLRYATEFLRPVLPAKAATRALAAMRDALDALGAYTDVLVAEQTLSAPAGGDSPGAWFARGWLAAERERRLAAATKSLQRWAESPRAWR